ncbi:MAG: hypothetical protein RR386_02150 [Bacteroidaceae bacterium]
MKAKEQTIQEIERALRKIAAKYPLETEDMPVTDIHLQVKQDSGELLAFDDNDKELNRCIIEEWIDNKEEDFYEMVQSLLCKCISDMKEKLENLGILKPYSFTLMDDDRETITDLYLVDDDTLILDDELMKGLSEELDRFLKDLLK